ncbi:MAG: hypothetical protein IT345_10590 [Trueperaceae bacterium]|nr:hypothetical protein [Trueperaceae bacterium]
MLDFDIENRPLSYWVPDRPTAEITAIASCWVDDPSSMQVDLLGELPGHELLHRFLVRYNQADLVTGHYIRKHDLPIINGALYELSGSEQYMGLLGPKLTCDTKLDMFKKADVPATQEFLLDTLQVTSEDGVPFEKYHMSQTQWREANRLTPRGLAETRARVESDVRAHIALRAKMLKLGMLRGPRVWNPGGGFSEVTEGRHA